MIERVTLVCFIFSTACWVDLIQSSVIVLVQFIDYDFHNFLFSGPPGPPIIKAFPRVLAIYVTWNASLQDINNAKILSYRIKISSGTSVIRPFTTITETSLEIKNLARNRTYVIEIKARNVVGYGETAKISATTLSAGKLIFISEH